MLISTKYDALTVVYEDEKGTAGHNNGVQGLRWMVLFELRGWRTPADAGARVDASRHREGATPVAREFIADCE